MNINFIFFSYIILFINVWALIYFLASGIEIQWTDPDEMETFSQWLLVVSNGELGIPKNDGRCNAKKIQIPPQYIIHPHASLVEGLIRFIYDNFTLQNPTILNLSEKAIVCLKNETAHEINMMVMKKTAGSSKIYLSTNSIILNVGFHGDPGLLYPLEYLDM